ncbi:Origin recognition complex subunit 1 [Phytophthora nicotianae]|uniref:Origin recognition complex subunit 1 n=1 Tax=Phytophthora nicotianae TaxID=4792 RepID=A0A0W8DJF5_PHYNI|nr:Origin recognition complex subunit 1 [Phytophthora nicotianae]
MAPPVPIPAASTATRSEHGRVSRHEESGLMSDEDFYDAQEDAEADATRQASAAAITITNQQSGDPELENKIIDPDDSKYIVKNKDTGEVFDIRDLSSMPADSYSIFPNDFVAPQEEETLSKHTGTIWTMKFSHDGARLVSGGQDAILRVWKVQISSEEDAKLARESDEKHILDAEPERSYQGHTMPIVDVSWSRSNFILSASMDKV